MADARLELGKPCKHVRLPHLIQQGELVSLHVFVEREVETIEGIRIVLPVGEALVAKTVEQRWRELKSCVCKHVTVKQCKGASFLRSRNGRKRERRMRIAAMIACEVFAADIVCSI